MINYISPDRHRIIQKSKNIILNFQEMMNSYSTSQLNGGIQKVNSCFNHELSTWINTTNDLPNCSIREYFKKTALNLGLNYEKSTGLMTTASMDNASLVIEKEKDISIFTLITAGVYANALRAGDPASYYEKEYNNFVPLGGTINIILVVEAFLPIETLARIPIIITEAKTAAIQDLGVKSIATSKIATGTGTDGIIALCPENHKIKFSDCGNHSLLGQLISKVVIKGVKESLIKEKLDYLNKNNNKKL